MKKIRVVTNGEFLIVRRMNFDNRLREEFESSDAGCYDSVMTYEDCEQDRLAMDDLKKYTTHVLASTGSYFSIKEIDV